MTKSIAPFLIISLFMLGGCQAIGEIFKAGVWFGVFLVVGLIALVVYFINRNKN